MRGRSPSEVRCTPWAANVRGSPEAPARKKSVCWQRIGIRLVQVQVTYLGPYALEAQLERMRGRSPSEVRCTPWAANVRGSPEAPARKKSVLLPAHWDKTSASSSYIPRPLRPRSAAREDERKVSVGGQRHKRHTLVYAFFAAFTILSRLFLRIKIVLRF